MHSRQGLDVILIRSSTLWEEQLQLMLEPSVTNSLFSTPRLSKCPQSDAVWATSTAVQRLLCCYVIAPSWEGEWELRPRCQAWGRAPPRVMDTLPSDGGTSSLQALGPSGGPCQPRRGDSFFFSHSYKDTILD